MEITSTPSSAETSSDKEDQSEDHDTTEFDSLEDQSTTQSTKSKSWDLHYRVYERLTQAENQRPKAKSQSSSLAFLSILLAPF